MQSIKANMRVLMLCAGLILILTGCGTTGSNVPSVACEAFDPITWSAKDTTQTVRQIVGHNATGKAICPYSQNWKSAPQIEPVVETVVKVAPKKPTFKERFHFKKKIPL